MRNYTNMPGFSEMSFSKKKIYSNIAKYSPIDLRPTIIPNDKCCGRTCPGGCICDSGFTRCFEVAEAL